MKKTISLVLVLLLCMAVEVLNADFVFGTPTNLGPPINSSSGDAIDCFSSDGLEMYFDSSRSSGSGGWDIWVAKRPTTNDDWGIPENLKQVNTGQSDGVATISADELEMYFNSNRPGGHGDFDIWGTKRETKEDNWRPPVNLGPTINGSSLDGSPYLSADGLELYFSSRRSGGYGSDDIWVTRRITTNDPWGPPVNLGPVVNSTASEGFPFVSSNGLLLFFSEDIQSPIIPEGFGKGDMWVTSRASVSDPWDAPVNLGPIVNGPSLDTGARISPDGSMLYFNSERLGGLGGWYGDIYQVPILSGSKVHYPNPADGAFHEDTWASLSCSPGHTAASHDVYIGDNFEDVNNGAEGTFQGNQTSMYFVVGFPGFPYPDGLVPGKTYYWRIDAVEAEGTVHKGDVWSFSIPPKTAYAPDPADTAETVDVDVTLSWTAGFGTKLHTVYFGDNFAEVDNATGGLPQGAATFTPGLLKMAKTYYWRVDEFDVSKTYKGDIWSFTTEGAVAALDPGNGAVDVTQTPVLTWAPGLGASYEVYFGADETSLELKGSGNLGSESYDPGQLEWDTTYYWRVDEANNANADSPWTGPLWSLTTADFLIIDDMESYNDLDPTDPASNRIFNVWLDGLDNSAINGSVVGHENPPFAEQTIVHSGNQSMPMAYDNAVGKSEATLTLNSNRDWTVNGVNTLTIWFRGSSSNAAEPLYVALNDSAVVTNDNPDAALTTSWTAWNIDLQAFADQGISLSNVSSITLGLGNRNNPAVGGAGMMYFDDIRLYPPAP